MDSATLKKVLTFLLMICLLIGLIVFCVLFIVIKSTPSSSRSNTTVEELRQTTEHDHGDHRHPEMTSPTLGVTTTELPDSQGGGYEVKLKGGPEGNSGKVLIEYNGTTGFVCHDEFDHMDALVVCRELGYQNGFQYRLIPFYPPTYSRYTTLTPVLTGLHCDGNETKLSECEGFELRNDITTCTWFATVLCYDDTPYELRLVGGIQPNSGMVEMKVGGVWGIFCAMGQFNDDVADILCRGMNFSGGYTSSRGMLGEAPRSKIWVPYILCHSPTDQIHSIFDCDLVLNTENIAYDIRDRTNNRRVNEYKACVHKPNSYAATVQCLV